MWAWIGIAAAVEGVTVGNATAIVVDGHLDEAAWTSGEGVTHFQRFQPTDGGEPDGKTTVRFLQDDKALYVGIKVEDASYPMRARISPRESINADDQIGVYLDTFRDGISGYIFYFNALGIQQDIRHNAGDWNVSWDTLLRSQGRLTESGFELEVAFPWRSLKFPGEETQDWGVILTRKIPGEGAKYSWPKLERGTPRIFQNANRLQGVRPPSRGSGLELVPSLITGTAWPREEEPGPLDLVRPSLDVQFGITPDVGLAATVNPDFSQVESDVSDVRLNAQFAFQFPERRRFFLDGADWFNDRANTLYSRTMNAPIAGLKVGGREGPVSIGALSVLDRDPLPSFTEGGTPGFNAADVEGRLAATNYLRARTDAFGLGYAGVTLSDKRLVGTQSNQQTAGVDFEVPMGDRWIGAAHFQQSVTRSEEGGLWGLSQSVMLDRATGVGTGATLLYRHRSPGFRNDVGFITQSDVTDGFFAIDHTLTPGGVHNLRPEAWVGFKTEGNGDRRRSVGIGENLILSGIHEIGTGFYIEDFREQGEEVLGGGARGYYQGNWSAKVDFGLDGEINRSIDFFELVPGTSSTVSAIATLRPTAGIRNDLTVRGNWFSPAGGQRLRSQLVRNRLNWQFTRELGARWVLDYSGRTEAKPRLFNAVLFTWLRNPGTAIWVGGSLTREAEVGVTDASVFAKATILIRP